MTPGKRSKRRFEISGVSGFKFLLVHECTLYHIIHCPCVSDMKHETRDLNPTAHVHIVDKVMTHPLLLMLTESSARPRTTAAEDKAKTTAWRPPDTTQRLIITLYQVHYSRGNGSKSDSGSAVLSLVTRAEQLASR